MNKPKRKKRARLIGWKQVTTLGSKKSFILKLEIPSHALRVFPAGKKHKGRASEAKVLAAYEFKPFVKKLVKAKVRRMRHAGYHDAKPIVYWVGRKVFPDRYNHNSLESCAAGINFYLTITKAQQNNGYVRWHKKPRR